MTSRKVTVIESIQKGLGNHGLHDESDDGILINTTPDIAVIYLEGVNCSPSDFIQWFLTVEESLGRYDLIWGDDNSLIDIGGSPLNLSPGAELEVTFDEYFAALLELRISEAKRALDFDWQAVVSHTPHCSAC